MILNNDFFVILSNLKLSLVVYLSWIFIQLKSTLIFPWCITNCIQCVALSEARKTYSLLLYYDNVVSTICTGKQLDFTPPASKSVFLVDKSPVGSSPPWQPQYHPYISSTNGIRHWTKWLEVQWSQIRLHGRWDGTAQLSLGMAFLCAYS